MRNINIASYGKERILADREYLYAETEGVKLLKLSYGGSASMLLAMPEQGAMDWLLKDLAHRDGLDLIRRWQASMTKHQVDVWLPKFKMEERYELKELLTVLGMGQAFSDSADFSAMTEDKKPIYINNIVCLTSPRESVILALKAPPSCRAGGALERVEPERRPLSKAQSAVSIPGRAMGPG